MADAAHHLSRLYSAAWYPTAALEEARALLGDACRIELQTTTEGTRVQVSGDDEAELWRVFHDLGNLALSRSLAAPAG